MHHCTKIGRPLLGSWLKAWVGLEVFYKVAEITMIVIDLGRKMNDTIFRISLYLVHSFFLISLFLGAIHPFNALHFTCTNYERVYISTLGVWFVFLLCCFSCHIVCQLFYPRIYTSIESEKRTQIRLKILFI
jgi:hypothetical protein